MGNQKQVVHFEAKKGFTTAQSNEHQRNWTEKGWDKANANGRIDRSRTHLNFEIIKGGKIQPVDTSKSIPQKFKENISSRGIKDPNEKYKDDPKIRTIVDFIISGSHDTLSKMAFGSQQVDYSIGANNSDIKREPEIELWAKDMYDTLSGKFGEENIISFVVHLDEKTAHIHADIIPVSSEGKISFKTIFSGEDKYEYQSRTLELHDLFAKVNEKWGLGRGDSVHETHRKHISCEEYRRELSSQCNALEKEISSKTAEIDGLNKQIRQAETRIKGLSTMISNLESAYEKVRSDIEYTHRALSNDNIPLQHKMLLQDEEESLKKKMEEILAKLEDKRLKLKEADIKLSELQKKLEESKAINENFQKQIESSRASASEIALNKIEIEALHELIRDFQSIFKSLTPDQSVQYDDSLIQDMCQKGNHIIACAALLSLGLVDQATNFAMNTGGGGGNQLGGWGREKDEDENAWLRRCLAQSRKMMKPSGHKMRR